MTAALALLGYAVVVSWFAPALLAPLTSGGHSVRPGLCAWLAAMASVLLAAALSTAFIVQAAAASWPTLTRDLCREVAGSACTPQVYQSTLYPAGVAVLAVAVVIAAVVTLWRYGRSTRRAVTSTRMHARAALLTGRALAGIRLPGAKLLDTTAVVLEDARPAAYCAAGRPPAIVVTSGALAVLDERQLAAVLAHEHAHLAGRHHLLATVTRGLTAAFPGVPLFVRGAEVVACLAELAADDAAARSAGRRVLATALVAIATGTAILDNAVPGSSLPGLAAAAFAVPARVERLLQQPRPGTAVMVGLALALMSAALILVPALLAVVAGGS